MTFKERLKQIELEQQVDSTLAKLETEIGEQAAEPPLAPYTEEGTPVHCSECGNNTFREQHNAIMCTNCGHGPFCNYCWKAHIREFHPLLVQPYEDATRGIRRRARFLNHYLIRTVVKPAGFVVGLAALLAVAYFAYVDRGGEPDRAARVDQSAGKVDQTSEVNQTGKVDETGKVDQTSEMDGRPGPEGHAPAPAAETAAPAGSPALDGVPGVELVGVTSPVSRNKAATMTVRTAPGALCTIQVRYRSGPSRARGLEPRIADASGQAAWSWRVGRHTTIGDWPIEVVCAANNETSTLTASIAVRD